VSHANVLTVFRNEDSPLDLRSAPIAQRVGRLRRTPPDLHLRIYSDLASIEADWRNFERVADCTVFQTFDWLATWQRHIGERRHVRPVIAVGSYADGGIAFLLPLCIAPGRLARRLSWLGQELCDYNAPLLARDFSERVTPERFLAAWHDLQTQMRCEPLLRHDWIDFEKMPATVGDQINPFTYLNVAPHPSGAHLALLGNDWEEFYHAKRSSATRRRDRAKRRHMSEFGEIRFESAANVAQARETLETLMDQKSLALKRKGIPDMFAPPGHREFYLALVSDPKLRHLVHVSRVDVGPTCAAANLGVVFGDCYYHVLASLTDGPVAHYGPGVLHLRELMAFAIARGLKRFDFTIGDEPYKLDWSDLNLTLYDYAATVTWRGAPAQFVFSARRRIKRLIKQTPSLWNMASRARAAIGALSVARHPRPQQRTPLVSRTSPAPDTSACVMGDIDLLRPLALAGVRCAVVARPGVPSLHSRYAHSRLAWDDHENTDALAEALLAYGKAQPDPPVLFYQEDGHILLVSRQRERLAQAFRFVVADATLVDDLLDKARFQALAERHGLPVPAARSFDPAVTEPSDLGLRFPLIIKPLTRLDRWNATFGLRKALRAENIAVLRELWPQLRALGIPLLAQEFVYGAESRIESYHCYVDRDGRIAGEFTGRKIRTYPASYGHTTALEITETADVRRLGRDVVERLQLTGVAKLDFKRDPHGNLRLLEINPRFTLWHHAGAVAGINIPALVYADLTGLPRPPATRVKAGVRWCRVWKDFPAAREGGLPLTAWTHWMLGSEAKSALSWDDPLPFLRAALFRQSDGRVGRATTGTWRGRAAR
jgi:D-aspartate ligase